MSGGWTALLLAGQRPGVDPLAAHFGERWKAKVPVAGRSMLARVARTLLDVPAIDRLVIVAQDPAALLDGDCAWLAADPRVALAVSGDGIARSIAGIAGGAAAPWPVLVTTADHPLLDRGMIEQMIAGAAGVDVAVGIVGRRRLLAAYPENRRTWLRFAGEAWSGANLFALTGPAAARALEAWSAVERDRKKALLLLWRLGPSLAILAVLRLVTLERALRRAGRRLGIVARPVALSAPEAAIDVDKPSDHALAESILVARDHLA